MQHLGVHALWELRPPVLVPPASVQKGQVWSLQWATKDQIEERDREEAVMETDILDQATRLSPVVPPELGNFLLL